VELSSPLCRLYSAFDKSIEFKPQSWSHGASEIFPFTLQSYQYATLLLNEFYDDKNQTTRKFSF